MDKPTRRRALQVVATLLRQVRQEAGLRQEELAKRLRKPQSYVSKLESAERRADAVEVWELCRACGVSYPDFAARLEVQLASELG